MNLTQPAQMGLAPGAMSNTVSAFKDAWPFGLSGAVVGFGLGCAAQMFDLVDADAQSILTMGAVGALTGGIVGQVGGAIYIGGNRGARVMMTPTMGLGGAAAGMVWTKLKGNRTDVKGVIKSGLVGGLVGTSVGGAIDLLMKAAGR